jgi:hypothetical protein
MQISRFRLALICGQFIEDTIPKLWLEEKSRAKPERQKATKGGNEFVAICRFNLPPFVTFCRF